MHRPTHLITLVFFLPFFAFSQRSLELEWERKFSSFNYPLTQESAQCAIQTMDGGLAFTGDWNPRRKTGQDVFLVVLNKNFEEMVKENTTLGWAGDERGNGLVQTYDGGFAIAGFTISGEVPGRQGGMDAWLIKTDEHGTALWDKVIGSNGDDSFYGLAQDATGNLVAVGTKNGQIWFYKTDWLGKKLTETAYPGKDESGQAIAPSGDGGWLLTGFRHSGSDWVQIVLKTDENGRELWRKEFKNAKGEAIIEDDEGNILTAGISYADSRNRDQALMRKLSPGGDEIWFREFGKFEDDGASAIIQDFDGNYLTAGYGTANRGARKPDLFITKYDKNGVPQWQDPAYFGERSEDAARSLVLMDNGGIVAAGYSASESLSQDAWLMRFKPSAIKKTTSVPRLKLENPQLVETNGNGILDPNERGYFSLDISNVGNSDAIAAYITLSLQGTPLSGLEFFEKIMIGRVKAGQTKKVSLPVATFSDLGSGRASLEAKLWDDSGNTWQPALLALECKKATSPELSIELGSFLVDNQTAKSMERGNVATIDVTVANNGDDTAHVVRLRFDFDDHVLPLNNPIFEMGDIQPGQTIRQSISFKVDGIYKGDMAQIEGLVMEKSGRSSAESEFQIMIVDPAPVVPTVIEPRYTNIGWVYPETSTAAGQALICKDSALQVKVIAFSTDTISERDFTLLLDGKEYRLGAKMDKGPLKRDGKKVGKQYRFTFEDRVFFPKPGTYKLAVRIANGSGESETETIDITYEPVKPNLHILAIGVPHSDLAYTARDAEDFATAMQKQKGKLYGNVFTTLLNTKEKTTYVELLAALFDLKQNYLFQENIQDKDVLMVFISSHGNNFSRKDGFRLLASDYKPMYPKFTSIDYKEDILGVLDTIKCKKYVFIDACQSGAIQDLDEGSKGGLNNISDAINNLISAENSLRSIVSCSKDELSYEDPAWENGAFTEALIEAFNDVEGKTEKGNARANADGDAVLTMGELYGYLSERVPYLVKTTKPKAPKQHPFMPKNDKSEDLPLIFYEK